MGGMRQERGNGWAIPGIVAVLAALVAGTFLIIDGVRVAAAERQAVFEAEATATAQSVTRFTQPGIDAALMLAEQIVAAKGARVGRGRIREMAMPVLNARPEFLGVAVAFEPNGYDGKDASYQFKGTEHDGDGRFVPYYYKQENGDIAADWLVMTVEAGIESWYLDPLRRKTPMLVGPYLYPVDDVDVSLVTVSVPLLTDGAAFGIVTVDLVMTDLLRDLRAVRPAAAGRVAVLSDDEFWLLHPDPSRVATGLMKDVGDSASAREAGFDEAALATAYRSYQTAHSAAPQFAMQPDGTGFYFVPITFAGVSERWTLITAAPKGGFWAATPASLSIPGLALVGGGGALIILFIFLRLRMPAVVGTVQSRPRSRVVERR